MIETQFISLLFTDVEGSTRLWDQRPADAAPALALHDQIAAEVAEQCGVEIVKARGEGDSLFIVSPDAKSCLKAALELQDRFGAATWPGGVELKVRMALHWGRVETRDNDFYGGTVNRAARLRAIAHGGQIIVSSAFRAALDHELPPGIELVDHGTHRLRDLEGAEHVFEVRPKGSSHQFPALRSLSTHPNNLPTVVSTFVGRTEELHSVRALLAKSALTTLTGSGGTGKTRLALQAGADAIAIYPGGVWVIELATANEPNQVVESIARSVGIDVSSEAEILDALVKRFGHASALLIFDNCEHLLDRVATTISALHRASKNITFLCTSREPLGLSGEHVYRVPPLGLPHDVSDLDHVRESAAVQLFLERCVQANSDFSAASEDLETIARICVRLDGIPLAIELAAARTRVLTVAKISGLLDDRFRLLTGGSKTSMPRQQTLEATIAWSFNLLSAVERELLVCLGVFGGSFSLEAAQSVCSGGMDLDEWDVLDGLTSLVDKSLVQYDAFGSDARYRLLESIRHYCLGILQNHLKVETVREAHADFFCNTSASIKNDLGKGLAKEAVGRAALDAENYRIAFDYWSHGEAADDRGLTMFCNLAGTYESMGRLREGFGYGSAMLQQRREPTQIRSDALNFSGNMAQSLGLADEAIAAYEESLAIRRELQDQRGIAAVLNNLGNVFGNAVGDFQRAEQYYSEALESNRASGNRLWEAFNLINLGVNRERKKDPNGALQYFQQSLQILEELGNRPMTLFSHVGMGNAKLTLGEFDDARRCFGAALETCLESSNLPPTTTIAEGVWRALRGLGQLSDAAWVLGVERQLRTSLEIPVPSSDFAAHEEAASHLRDELGAGEFQKQVTAGETTGRDAALERIRKMALS